MSPDRPSRTWLDHGALSALSGRRIFSERLSLWQWIAGAGAPVGVAMHRPGLREKTLSG